VDAQPLLREIELERPAGASEYPFTVPAVAGLKKLQLRSRVTFFVGENGSGKSTLLEALAVASGLAFEGGSRNFRIASPPPHHGESQAARIEQLADALTLRWRKRPRDAFFLRAESFYNVVSYLEQIDGFDAYGGESLHTRSHGESFMTLLLTRISGGGLYLLDEPEAALSAARQLALLVRMHQLLESKPETQFIIATHSPIVLAFPGAQIFSFDRTPPCEIDYRLTDAYAITRRFLADPDRALSELWPNERA
jgi:predicted ATPase